MNEPSETCEPETGLVGKPDEPDGPIESDRPDKLTGADGPGGPTEPDRTDESGRTKLTEPDKPTEPDQTDPLTMERRTSEGRPGWAYRVLALTIISLACLAVWMTLDEQADDISVKEAVTHASRYKGQKVQVFGNTEDWNPVGDRERFVLNDTHSTFDEYYILEVDAGDASVPSSFAEDKLVRVTGSLIKDKDGKPTLLATEIKVGCPSKYEEEAG